MNDVAVLVVDDETSILRVSQSILEEAGFQVVTTFSPVQALAVLESHRIDLLLVDIHLPGMDGFQLVRLARERHPDLAVVILTGYGTLEVAIEILHRGADSLILKPIVERELVRAVENALHERERNRDVIRLRTLSPLFDITKGLFRETDPQKLQSLILDAIYQSLVCDYAILYERDSEKRVLTAVDQRGDCEAKKRMRLENQFVEYSESHHTALWVNQDGSSEHGFPFFQDLIQELELSSLICVPVYCRTSDQDHNHCTFLAARESKKDPFRLADFELLSILAHQAGVAMENAYLYSELRSYIEQLEKSQHALIQAEKIAAAGRLTANIAHEINNPLQAVYNCLHLAGRENLSPGEKKKYIDLATNEVEHLIKIVQRMLDLYRPGVRDRQMIDLDELINRVLLLLEQQLKKNGIQVETSLWTYSTKVMVVPSQIQQVLLNLILNAMEAMPDGGRIFIETGLKGDQVEVLIEDEGQGIPAGEEERIFEPFNSTKENGTGLGLPVSYSIISAYGGTLELISGRGRGACFQILLPTGVQG